MQLNSTRAGAVGDRLRAWACRLDGFDLFFLIFAPIPLLVVLLMWHFAGG